MKDAVIKKINIEFPYKAIRDLKTEIKRIQW
jgi:hypothetical protein